jgi:deoxyadenosine/deoxycytidine kinase
LPPPELIVRLNADVETVASRLSRRDRVNIASAEDTALFNSFLDEWLASIPSDQVLTIDVSNETLDYAQSIARVIEYMRRHF